MNDQLFGPAAKVTAAHLARDAYLYIRQSSLKQVLNNTESTVRQYGLKERALALGWPADRIIVIDTDQGQSGASAADREGFQRLVTEVGMGHAGIVLGLEVSRLARNNTDWHRLLEICAMSGTLILDEDGLYDPCDFNDRLLLGLKGSLSEAELHLLKARLRGGQLSKARRGELISPLPIGLVYDGAGKVVLDPGCRDPAGHRCGLRAVRRDRLSQWRGQGVQPPGPAPAPPRRARPGQGQGRVGTEPSTPGSCRSCTTRAMPARSSTAATSTNPPPAPGSAGRSCCRESSGSPSSPAHHPGYITLEKYDANQAKLTSNAAAHGKDRRHGPPREGPALLQGIVLCGICGRRMTVRYHQRQDTAGAGVRLPGQGHPIRQPDLPARPRRRRRRSRRRACWSPR